MYVRCKIDLRNRLQIVPAESFALFLGNFLDDGERLGAAILTDGGKQRIEESHGRDIGSRKRRGFNRSQKDFVTLACQGREVSICNADTIRAASAGLLRAFHSLPKTPAKANGDDQVLLINGPNEVQNPA